METALKTKSARPRRGASAAIVAGLSLALLVGTAGAATADPKVRPVPNFPAAPAAKSAAADTGARFTPLSPVRVLDTRAAIGVPGTSPLPSSAIIALDLSPYVPAGATAVVLNVTGIAGASATYVKVYPHGTARPQASNLNLTAGAVRPNAVTVALGSGTAVDLYNQVGNTHLLADLAGYYAPGTSGSLYTPLSPQRALDTRDGTGQGGVPASVGSGATISLNLNGVLPSSATAVTFNLTGVGATAGTFVTAWPSGTVRPNASNLNLVPNQVAPNQVTVAIGGDRRVNLYNHGGFVNLVVDIAGFYDPSFGSLFHQLAPQRVVDTRYDGLGSLPGGYAIRLPVGLSYPAADALVFNLTGTEPTAPTYLTAWPLDEPLVEVSNLNLTAGQTAANLATVAVDVNGDIGVYNAYGYVHVIIDLAGYFAPVGS